MSRARDHHVTIERRGRSHKAVCSCSWSSHAWNELRPAEADAWHHVYGETVIVDVSSIPDERSAPIPSATQRAGRSPLDEDRRSVDDLVQQARELASRPSPYSRNVAPELWHRSGGSRATLTAAIGDVEQLLARHDRRSSGAADSEWLQLITAKRLLLDCLSHGDDSEPRMHGEALI